MRQRLQDKKLFSINSFDLIPNSDKKIIEAIFFGITIIAKIG